MCAVEEVPQQRAAERRPATAAADDDDDEGLGWCGTAVCGGFVLGSIFLLGLFLNRNAEPYRKLKVESFANDEVLRTVVWPQNAGSARGGPNGPDVDWAIFFYKPYCGACRRVRPVFHALARTTNATAHLRFGEVDCVKHRSVCSMLEVESLPSPSPSPNPNPNPNPIPTQVRRHLLRRCAVGPRADARAPRPSAALLIRFAPRRRQQPHRRGGTPAARHGDARDRRRAGGLNA